MPIKRGAIVRIRTFVPEGPVLQTRYDESAEQLEHLVEFDDAEGETQQRWTGEDELELIQEAPAEPEGETEGEGDE